MKKLDRLISWLEEVGFSEEVEILKEAGRGEAKLMRGSNFNLALSKILKELPDDESDVKERVIELMNKEMSEGDMDYFSKDDISNVGGYEERLQNLNKVERLAYYLSDLYLGRDRIMVPDGYKVDEVIKDYLFSGRFHQPGIMSERLNFITPVSKLEISPNDYRTNSEILLEDFELYLIGLTEKEMKKKEETDFFDKIEKVKIYSDGDYIAYIPGDPNPNRYDHRHYSSEEDEPEDLEKCYSEARKFYGDKMGNCLGGLQFHHCDSDKIYIYFSNHKTPNNPEVMINIIDGKLDQIENKYQLEETDKKIYDRVIEFSLNNSDGLFNFLDNSAYDYFYRSSSAEKMYKEKYINTHSSQEKILSELMSYDTNDYAVTVNNAMAQILAKDDSRIGALDNFITNPKSYEFKKIFGGEKMQEVFDYYKEKGKSMDTFIYLAQQNFLLDPSYDIFMKIKNNIPKDFYERLDEDTDSYWVIKLIARTKVEDFYKLSNLIKEMKSIYDNEKYEYDDFCLSGVTINDNYDDSYVTTTFINFEEKRYKIKLVEVFDYGEYGLYLDIDFY